MENLHVVAVTPDRRIVMVEQYRFGSGEIGLEPPAGIVDAAEETLEASRFEVLTIPVPAVSEDVVVAHSPAAGADAPRGSVVVVYAGG